MQKGCPKCGRMIDENLTICPYCNYDFKEIDEFLKKVNHEKFTEEEKYAGFIKRLVAGMIDINAILIITYIIFLIIDKFLLNIEKTSILAIAPLFILLYIFLNAVMERTSWHASLGKHIVGIEVVDEYENPITFGEALLRNIAKFLNVLTLGIGFLICVAPPKQQTLSDKITNTYVLNKISFSEEKSHDYASSLKRLLSFIIDIIVIFVIVKITCYICDYIVGNIPVPDIIKDNKNKIKTILIIFISILYFPLYESKRGKTTGKKYLKIKMTDQEENTITFLKAFIREMLIIVDLMTFGFLLPFSSKKHQTLKDILTKTIVIDD